ncbi:MAG: rhamnogalacturonan lyase [Halobacteriaceae archaeon]
MPALDRGLVAVDTDDGVYVRWRLFATEPADRGFNLYRDGDRVNDDPITDTTNFLDAAGTADATYEVRPVVDGSEGDPSKSVAVWDQPYLEIPLQKPGPVEGPNGGTVTYHANDASVGDLTGNGRLDLVLQWSPSNAKDNSRTGKTNQTILDAYTLDGDHLWRVELGINVRAGAHYTQFLVYDFDGDGKAELACRTADGTTDGEGTVIGDPNADHRNEEGFVLTGPEFLTVFDGETGAALDTVDYRPARGDICDWGDCWGNRGDRFLAGVAYLDGERPSIVNGRGYYEKTMLSAFDFRDGSIDHRWTFDSDDGNEDYAGQGNHQLAVADVDDDGKDEIVYGAMAIDHDGTGLYSTGWGHGDAMHVGDLDPDREGLEVFQIHEARGPWNATFRDAETGDLIWGSGKEGDTGRGMAANVDPNHRGVECWASGEPTHTADGERLYREIPSANSAIWWTGDLTRQLLDHDWQGEGVGIGLILDWQADAKQMDVLERFSGTRSNNWTKGNPCLSGDVLGDWREEVIWRTPDSEALRLFVTTHETEHRLYTLLHDPQYRLALAWQNVAYNQPPHPSFYVGSDMDAPPTPDIELLD